MRGKIKYLVLISIMILSGITPPKLAEAESCPDIRIVFARGSGGERWTTDDYLEFKTTIESKLATTGLKYEFIDLDYPAVGIGIDKLAVTIGAYVGGGDKYEFGKSVNKGVSNLKKMVDSSCPNTRYVIGGYSQGAVVVSKALSHLNPDRIIYAATFGDPKIYLPEGKGPVPAACSGKNLSDYRAYVPDCMAYKGLLGAINPYQPENYIGKLGTWCNKMDVLCSSHLGINDHLNYISDGLYEDASRVIFDKITKYYGIENHISSPHDTVIMLDSTGSMNSLISQYKKEALRLATKTFESGGRIALYDYRDINDPYSPVEHCNFETCTLDIVREKLDKIKTSGGGDKEESLLSASFSAMKSLKWKFGATKSIVVLTDAPFLSPDRDGVTLDEVIRLSKEIDPVNFYIITNEESANSYALLTEGTDGKTVTDFGALNLLTDYIMERYDSLPRVEEGFREELPMVEITEVTEDSNSETRIRFNSNGDKTIVIINDEIVGVTEQNEITIKDLDNGIENQIILVPITENLRGEGESVVIKQKAEVTSFLIPKVPNTGKR